MKNNLEFKPKLIDLCYKASLEKIKGKGSYLAQTKENLEKQIQILTSKQDRLLDTLLNKTISEEVYQAKDKKIPGLFNTI